MRSSCWFITAEVEKCTFIMTKPGNAWSRSGWDNKGKQRPWLDQEWNDSVDADKSRAPRLVYLTRRGRDDDENFNPCSPWADWMKMKGCPVKERGQSRNLGRKRSHETAIFSLVHTLIHKVFLRWLELLNFFMPHSPPFYEPAAMLMTLFPG